MPRPRLVSPRPIRAPAVMMAPTSARMVGPPGLEVQHAGAAGEHQQDARDHHEETATAAAGPGAVRPTDCVAAVEPAAAEERPQRSCAHAGRSDRFGKGEDSFRTKRLRTAADAAL